MKFFLSYQTSSRFYFSSVLISCMMFVCLTKSSAQYATGLYNSNFSGVHGSLSNPAFGPHGFLGWDVNIGSAQLFVSTNYATISNSNLFEVLDNLNNIPIANSEDPLPPGSRSFQFNNSNRDKYFSTKLDVVGPSAYVESNGLGFGIFTRFRAEASSYDIPSVLGYEQFNATPFNEVSNFKPLQAAGLAWAEYGINVATTKLREDQKLSIGISLKYLSGYEAFHITTTGTSSITRLDSDNLQLNSAVAQLALSSNLSERNLSSFQVNGNGIGFDLGISLDLDRIRLGFSILDMGKLAINHNAELHRLVINNPISIPIGQLTSEANPTGALNQLSEIVQTNSTDTIISLQGLSVGLPTRLNLSVDYMIRQHLYTSFQINQRLPTSNQAIKANNSITIAPRIEQRWFMVSVPVTIYNYQKLNIGFATRLGLLTIGSDNVLGLIGSSDFSGASIYAAIKINPFKDRSGRKGKNVQCPRIKKSPWNSHKPEKTARNK